MEIDKLWLGFWCARVVCVCVCVCIRNKICKTDSCLIEVSWHPSATGCIFEKSTFHSTRIAVVCNLRLWFCRAKNRFKITFDMIRRKLSECIFLGFYIIWSPESRSELPSIFKPTRTIRYSKCRTTKCSASDASCIFRGLVARALWRLTAVHFHWQGFHVICFLR